jgi:N utilization substance protein A
LDETTGTATVVVNSQQLSLAIGKEGQNARLAGRLTGWLIDVATDGDEYEEAATETYEAAPEAAEVVDAVEHELNEAEYGDESLTASDAPAEEVTE